MDPFRSRQSVTLTTRIRSHSKAPSQLLDFSHKPTSENSNAISDHLLRVMLGIALFWAVKTKVARDVEEEIHCDPESANRSVLLTCLLAPLVVPFMIVMCVPCAVTQCLHIWRCWQATRIHQDPELTPINMLELPKPARHGLESQTPEFFEHAFQMLEDVRWRTEPVQMDIRAFLAEEGDIFGTIFVADQDSPNDEDWLLLARGMAPGMRDHL